MELKDILNNNGIIGIVSNYKSNVNLNGKVSELKINNLNNALKIVGLDSSYADKDINELSISELWKIELISKLDKDIIIVGDLFNCLNYKDREYMKKLFIKLNNNYNKKIVIIDNNINSFINVVKKVYVMKNKQIVYETNDFYDDKLYEYVNMPKIIEFIKYINRDKKVLNENVDIYELIKDIYRSVS